MRNWRVLALELLLVIVYMSGAIWVNGQVAAPSATPSDPRRLAVTLDLEIYFIQFNDACFAKTSGFSIGNAKLFTDALKDRFNKFYWGAEGEQFIKDKGSDAIALHQSGKKGTDANIAFRFDPLRLQPLPTDFAQRQTLVHEITHHIEYINGVLRTKGNPGSERNTDFQDKVVDLLWQLYVTEDPARMPKTPPIQTNYEKKAVKVTKPSSMGDRIFYWQMIETQMAKLAKGSAGDGSPPDLLNKTGFNVDLPAISRWYAGGNCREEMQAMVGLSKRLPELNPNLQFEETDIAAGLRVKVVLETMSGAEIKVPADLRPRFVWRLPGGKMFEGNPVKLTRDLIDQEIPADVVVTFNKQNYVLGSGSYTLKGTSDMTSVKRNNVIGKYRGRFSGDLEGTFEFTVQEATSPSKLIKAVEGKLIPVGREIVLGWTTETAAGEYEILATITNADGSSNPARNPFTGKIRRDGTASGEWHIFDYPNPKYPGYSGATISKHGKWTTVETKLNLALNRPAAQSSHSPWSKLNDPQGAVDGVKNGSFGFHTDEELNPWWEVDLGEAKALSEIQIFNRIDHNPERSRTLQVYLSNDGNNWRQVFDNKGAAFGGVGTKPLIINVVGNSARYVRLQLAEKTWFHLDEVEIY